MGSTLEAQKAKAPKKKPKKPIVVTPGKPYYSSKALREGYEQTLPSATVAAQLRKGSLGRLSPRAAALDLVSGAINTFRSPEGRTGARLAAKEALQRANRKKGGVVRKIRVF